MSGIDSSNAPEFFFHHGFIDEIWARWQSKGPEFKHLAYYSENTDPMPAAEGHSPSTTYDLDNQPGCVKVCIQPPSEPCRVPTTFAAASSSPVCSREISGPGYSLVKLSNLIPRPFPSILPKAVKRFNIPPDIVNVAQQSIDLFGNVTELYNVIPRTYGPARI